MNYICYMMKVILLFSLMILLQTTFAQELDYYNPDYKTGSSIDGKFRKPFSLSQDIHTSFMAGNSVGYYGNNTGAFSAFVAPTAEYSFNKRFSIEAGTIFMNSTFFGTENLNNLNLNRNIVYVKGRYMLNDKFAVSGGAFYENNFFRNIGMEKNPTDMSSKGIMIGADYKVGENSWIGVQMEFSDRNPYFPGAQPIPNKPGPSN